MKVKVIYSATWGGNPHPFDAFGGEVVTATDPSHLTELDSVLIVWGGADISPDLYGHAQSRTTHPGLQRDAIEFPLMQRAAELGIPIIGVCRGAQMLCALAGGFLIQDVKGHHGRHTIETYDGETLTVNSIHHQMMAGLENVEHELLAWSTASLSSGRYVWKNDLQYNPPEGFVEPEFVYFPKVKGYAIQWHPEMMDESSAATRFILSEISSRETTSV